MNKDCQIIEGDCREVMRGMPEGSVHMCVTSPPYFGLRNYGLGDKGIGLEPTLNDYIANIVEVFQCVRRVLRDDGTLWLNYGDAYNSSPSNQNEGINVREGAKRLGRQSRAVDGLKPKDLIGQPWRIAFALQADGWYLRSDIIWHKPNPMPESVTDRPTKSHEHVFLLTKRPTYYYDAEAVREAHKSGPSTAEPPSGDWMKQNRPNTGNSDWYRTRPPSRPPGYIGPASGRNLRDVWTIPTEGYPGAHFATFPRKLVEPCIKAGTSDKGCCPECGAPWVQVVDRDRQPTRPGRDNKQDDTGMANRDRGRHVTDVRTVGWKPPGCECLGLMQARTLDPRTGKETTPRPVLASSTCLPPMPCTVLDPFVGSGTAGVVATQLGRRFVGIDLSREYCEMARKRIANPEPERVVVDAPGQMDLFQGDEQCKIES